jgi:hypothetical protein
MNHPFTQTVIKGVNQYTIIVDETANPGGLTVSVNINEPASSKSTQIDEVTLSPAMVETLAAYFAKKVF